MPGIVVGIDGSSHSARGLEWALNEAAIKHARLTVLTVHSVAVSGWSGNPILLPGDAEDQEKSRQAAEELTLKAASQLGEAQPARPPVCTRPGIAADCRFACQRAGWPLSFSESRAALILY